MNDRQIEDIISQYAERYGPLITAVEAAEIARRKVQTIYEWSSRGILDACKVRRPGVLLLGLREFVRHLLDGRDKHH